VRFDTFIDDPVAADARVPDGTHECVITKTKEWVSPEGVKKLIVTFRPDDESYNEFVKWFDPTERRDCAMAMAIAQHVGIAPNQGLGPNLVDKRIAVTTKRGTKKNGELTVYVNAVAASSHSQPAARESAATTPVPKRPAPGEDLPF